MRGCETDFGGSLGSRVSQCTDYRGEEVMLRLPRRPALPPALPPARTPPPRPPLPIFSLFPSLSSPPAPCRGTQAPCGVACGGGREGESVVGGARARAQRGGRAYVRGAARRARPCSLAPSASPNSLRPRGAAAARPRGARRGRGSPAARGRQHDDSGRRARGDLCGGSSVGRCASLLAASGAVCSRTNISVTCMVRVRLWLIS